MNLLGRPPSAYLACYLVLIRNGKICLMKRRNTGFEDGKYMMIAGHLEPGEGVKEAMRREAREEAGLSIGNEIMKVVHIMHRSTKDREYVDFFVEVRDLDQEPRNMEPDKCDEICWFDPGNLPENTVGYVKMAIIMIKEGKPYSEYGF